jgi:hypothetical protein
MNKLVLEGVVEYDKEDGGRALIATINDIEDADCGMFVRIQSWDDVSTGKDEQGYEVGFKHTQARQFEGKKVRVTVEVIDNDKNEAP